MKQLIIVGLAAMATYILLPAFYPTLNTLALDNAHGITWKLLATIGVVVAGLSKG